MKRTTSQLSIVSRIGILIAFVVLPLLRIQSDRHYRHESDQDREILRDLLRSGEICVTYGADYKIVEHHKARYWQHGDEGGYFCPDEDSKASGLRGMLSPEILSMR